MCLEKNQKGASHEKCAQTLRQLENLVLWTGLIMWIGNRNEIFTQATYVSIALYIDAELYWIFKLDQIYRTFFWGCTVKFQLVLLLFKVTKLLRGVRANFMARKISRKVHSTLEKRKSVRWREMSAYETTNAVFVCGWGKVSAWGRCPHIRSVR